MPVRVSSLERDLRAAWRSTLQRRTGNDDHISVPSCGVRDFSLRPPPEKDKAPSDQSESPVEMIEYPAKRVIKYFLLEHAFLKLSPHNTSGFRQYHVNGRSIFSLVLAILVSRFLQVRQIHPVVSCYLSHLRQHTNTGA